MSTAQELERTIGQDVYDVEGQKVGTAANLYASDLSGEPEWVTVKTGLFGSKESFVPLTGAHAEQDGLHVGARKDLIKDAPRIDDQGHLSEAEAASCTGTTACRPAYSGMHAAGHGTGSGGHGREGQGHEGRRPGVDDPVRGAVARGHRDGRDR